MPVIGFTITRIEAQKNKGPTGGNIDVSNLPKITSVETEDVKLSEKKIEKVLKMGFDFHTTFEPKVAHIIISGELLFMHPDQEGILKHWKKEGGLQGPILVEILNYLFRKCIIKTLNLTEDLQLPPNISFPVVRMEPEQKPSKHIK